MFLFVCLLFFKQKTAYDVRISDLSSDVCSSDLLPVEPGRIPLCDGAGEVVAVGDGVDDFVIGDRVVAVFHTRWISGDMPSDAMRAAPGDSLDGFAREFVVAPTKWFSRAPRGYSHAEAATQIGRASCRESVCKYV